MGKLKGYLEDWLEEYGYDLGYNWDNLPSLPDMESIVVNSTTYIEYRRNKNEENL